MTAVEQGWQDIASAPKDEWVIGLRHEGLNPDRPPVFVGKRYDLRDGCLIDQWSGLWVACSHWTPILPSPPEPGK